MFPHIAVCEDISVMGMILTVCDVINASLNSCAAGNNEKEMNGKYFCEHLPLMLL